MLRRLVSPKGVTSLRSNVLRTPEEVEKGEEDAMSVPKKEVV